MNGDNLRVGFEPGHAARKIFYGYDMYRGRLFKDGLALTLG
jgi:hypothetical protein